LHQLGARQPSSAALRQRFTAVLVGEHVYMANAGPGTLPGIELKAGKIRWEERLGQANWGSLVLADGKFYVPDQGGDTFVFAAKPEFELINRNRLGANEHTDASIAISNGDLFIRIHQHLWCIGRDKK
jgi:hypothetical protein